MLVLVLIIGCMAPVKAVDATATLKASEKELYLGDTFTVTLNITCEEGINGLITSLSYDEAKLELQKTEIIDTTKWLNFGESPNLEIMSNSAEKTTSADMVKLTFKVKETAPEGTKAKITANDIKIDSDTSTSSLKEVGTKEIEVSILERLKVTISDYEQEEQGVNKYIKKISPKTLIKTIKGKIQTNGNIKIFKNNEEISGEDNKIATGMEIRISKNKEIMTYKVVVKGDANGDGEATINDMLQINKHRLNKATLEDEYLKAADVNRDGKVDLFDILQINKYRLGKIESL